MRHSVLPTLFKQSTSIKITVKMNKRASKKKDQIEDGPFEDQIQDRDTEKRSFYVGLGLGFILCIMLFACIEVYKKNQDHYKPTNITSFEDWLDVKVSDHQRATGAWYMRGVWKDQYDEARDRFLNPAKWQKFDKENPHPVLIELALYLVGVVAFAAMVFCIRIFWECVKLTVKECKKTKRAKNRARLYKPLEDQV